MAVMVSERTIEALRGFDSPTVMNAVERFAVRDRTAGYANLDLKCLFPEREPLVGYAFTAIADTTTRPTRARTGSPSCSSGSPPRRSRACTSSSTSATIGCAPASAAT